MPRSADFDGNTDVTLLFRFRGVQVTFLKSTCPSMYIGNLQGLKCSTRSPYYISLVGLPRRNDGRGFSSGLFRVLQARGCLLDASKEGKGLPDGAVVTGLLYDYSATAVCYGCD